MKPQNQHSIVSCDFEIPFWQESPPKMVAGVDEVGRGCLAGPVVAAAVVLPPFAKIDGVNDSKQLSEKKRQSLFQTIVNEAVTFGIGILGAEIIDAINISQASVRAMNIAIDKLASPPDHVLVDGNYFHSCNIDFTTIIKGDSKSLSIAAASILAKVTRDNYMKEKADVLYPNYGFAQHKGYATSHHRTKIKQYGTCAIHRQTFLSKIMKEIEDQQSGKQQRLL